MVVKINGTPITYGVQESDICDEIVRNAPKLNRLAITLWITSGALLASSRQALAATDSTTEASDASQQIIGSLQDMVIAFGALAIVIGLILLVVKRKWGIKTLKMTIYITAGVFLAPTALLLVAIIAFSINDHLYSQFQQMRAHMHH